MGGVVGSSSISAPPLPSQCLLFTQQPVLGFPAFSSLSSLILESKREGGGVR